MLEQEIFDYLQETREYGTWGEENIAIQEHSKEIIPEVGTSNEIVPEDVTENENLIKDVNNGEQIVTENDLKDQISSKESEQKTTIQQSTLPKVIEIQNGSEELFTEVNEQSTIDSEIDKNKVKVDESNLEVETTEEATNGTEIEVYIKSIFHTFIN